jgi:hypothetical protein
MEKRMASIKDLLRYKKALEIRSQEGEIIKSVYIRLVNDEDLNKSSRLARIASTEFRAKLRDENTDEFKDQIAPIAELDDDTLKAMIVGSVQNQITQEAYVKINREELPKLEEFAIEPDAPSLEEQEELDSALETQQKEFEKKIDDYITDRVAVFKMELESLPREELIKRAQDEMVSILPLQVFFDEFNKQKLLRGTYEDKLCKVPSFSSIDDVRETHSYVRDQIMEVYTQLEINPTELKN